MATRRRRVGVGAAAKKNYSKKAEEIRTVSISSAIETVNKLETKLAEFATKHKDELQSDPAFRAKFLQMCGPLGVDPLSTSKNGGFWKKIAGLQNLSEFYYELAVKVAEVCIASRPRNGGIISISELQELLSKRTTKFSGMFVSSKNSSSSASGSRNKTHGGNKIVSKDDIITAIKKLSKLGSGFRTINVGSSTMIMSVPCELDSDHTEVMRIAQNEGGKLKTKNTSAVGQVAKSDIMTITGWTEERTERALNLLLLQGMAWIDSYYSEESYWFPSVWKEDVSKGAM